MIFQGLHLVKSFGHKKVVQDVSLSVSVGEAVGLLGPNGAGKTTSFLLMAGLIAPDSGKIFLNNTDVTHMPLYQKARMGLRYLPQDSSIFRGMTVEENILAVLEIFESNTHKKKQKLEELLTEFSLHHIRTSSALSLSGGERRRVEIARSLVGNPKFILLDEPCAGIDPKSIEDLQKLIHHITTQGIGVLITDHNVRDILKIINRGYVLHDGKILQEGSPQELAHSHLVRDVYLGHSFSL